MVRLGIALAVSALFAAGSASARDNISATLSATPGNYYGACPADLSFVGAVSAPHPGTIEFRFVRSDGAAEPPQKLLFAYAGTLPVGMTWHTGGRKQSDYRGWVAIEILEPVHLQSSPARFRLRCGSQYDGRGPIGIVPNDLSSRLSRGEDAFISALPDEEDAPVITLGPSGNPYLKWNKERIAGTPALEARLREYRQSNASCDVRIAPDRNADSQMLASLLSVIQRTDACDKVQVGVVGSFKAGRSLARRTYNEQLQRPEARPVITIGPDHAFGGVSWNGERLSGPDALESRLSDYRNSHDRCEVQVVDTQANFPAVSSVLDSMIRTGCVLALDNPPDQDPNNLPY